MGRRTWTDEQFVKAHSECDSVADLLRKLGLSGYGQSYETVRRACERLGLPYPSNQGAGMKRAEQRKKFYIPVEHYLVENKPCSSFLLKEKLFREGYKDRKCEICGVFEWMGKELRLQLDHINGDKSNNLLSNLRILCPNCHSQTDTWCGLSIKNKSEKPGRQWHNPKYSAEDRVCECGAKKYPKSMRCQRCYNSNRGFIPHASTEKIDWPDDESLLRMVSEGSFLSVGRKLGVSDNAVRSRLRRRGLTGML